MKTIEDILKEKGLDEDDVVTQEEFFEILNDQLTRLWSYKLLVKCAEDLIKTGYDQDKNNARNFIASVFKHADELPVEKVMDMINDLSGEPEVKAKIFN